MTFNFRIWGYSTFTIMEILKSVAASALIMKGISPRKKMVNLTMFSGKGALLN
jgi:hypothetical protein